MKKSILNLCLILLVASLALTGATISVKADEEKINFPLTFEDTSGREVTLQQPAQKIISLGPNMTELVFALGAGDRLVGRTSYCDYPEEALEVEEVGTLMEPDLEKITELEPDLVLASTHVDDDTLNKLTELEIPVLMLYDQQDLYGLARIIRLLGQALDMPEEAQKLEDDVFKKIYEAQVRASGLNDPRPTIYYVVGFGESGDFTAGGDTFINDIIAAGGGVNAAQDLVGWSFSQEKLVEIDPDIIIIPAWAEESFGKEAPYSELTAVKEGHVYTVDNNIFDRQGPRNAEAVEFVLELVEEYQQATAEAAA